MAADSGSRPRCLGKNALKLALHEIENARFRRKCILYSHDELHMRSIADKTKIGELAGTVNVGKIEYLDFRQNSVLFQLCRQAFDEGCRVFVNDRREVHRSGGKRSHVRFEVK